MNEKTQEIVELLKHAQERNEVFNAFSILETENLLNLFAMVAYILSGRGEFVFNKNKTMC
jgi:hypothetical protein